MNYAAPSEQSSAADQQLLAAMAAAVARFEAEVAPHVAAEAQPEDSLEDLRLRTPALRPVGCWCMGCGALQNAALPVRCLLSPMPHLISAPGVRRCRNLSGASEAGLRTLLCSGCNAARYCSAACQKAAWRAGHKGACQRLQQART